MDTTPGQIARWHPVADASELQQSAYQWIVDASVRAIAERSRFVIVLAGGNTPRGVYSMLRDLDTDWSLWDIWFGDERGAPPGDAERNSMMARMAWLDHIAIPHACIHVIPAEDGVAVAAAEYADALRDTGAFDLVLLGLGEDGHTASLFPDHDWNVAPDLPAALAVFDAPKPPPQRVSLSAARLGNAREVLFLVDGESKRDASARWQSGDAIPAAAIHPEAGVDVLIAKTLLLPST